MPLKWEKLGGKNDPPFETKVLIGWDELKNWTMAQLFKIETSADAKLYGFQAGDNEWWDATHFAIVEPPKIDPPKEQ
jgi:hypothetical protein